MLREEEFQNFLIKEKKPKNTIISYINRTRVFENYLKEKKNKGLEDVNKADLEDFILWGKDNELNVYQYFWGIRSYYHFISNEDIGYEIGFLMQLLQLEKFKLSNFLNINKEYIKMLSKIGIKTASDLIEKGKTAVNREKISNESGVPKEYVLELVQLSNLARAPGHMKVRARLYYECGLDTFDKMASMNVEEMIELVSKFIKETNFPGIPPTYGEAECSINHAKKISRIIEF